MKNIEFTGLFLLNRNTDYPFHAAMVAWTIRLEGGPKRVNHAAVAFNNRIFSFGGYCTGEDYERTRPMDVHMLNTGVFL